MSDGSLHERLTRAGRAAWALLGLAGVLVLLGIIAGRLSLVVVPLILALFPATLLDPVARWLKARSVPDSLAALLAMLLALLLVAGLIGAMVMMVAADLPELVESANSGFEQVEDFLREDPLGWGLQGPGELLASAREQLGAVTDYLEQAVSAGTAAARTVAGALLLTVILFFYLKDGRRLLDGILTLVVEPARARWRAAAEQAWDTLGHYFRGQLLVALVDAVFIGIGLVVLGIPLAVPLAVLIFFGALFPLIGAIITGSLAVLVALADTGLVSALLVLGLIIAVQQLEGNILQPYILSRAVRLHPLVVLLAVTAGGLLLGILGAFLAVPATAVVVRLLSSGSPLRSAEAPA
ncbi:MAG: AI-2E family transporter [Nitriliruptoraceae bacterium]